MRPLKNYRVAISLLLILVSLLFYPYRYAESGHIELHAHLFMKEGMGWLFNGEFFGPLQARNWKDGLSSQANPESLDQSGLDIVVVTLYAHPLLKYSLRNSIREQIQLTRKFVAENPRWAIANHPSQAKDLLAAGKRVLIFALEGASGILETEEDLKEFIDLGDIRIVTLLHLTDDQFGGVAFLKGWKALSSPLAFLKSIFDPHYDSNGVRLNSTGLSEDGKKMAQMLIKRNVWIDLAHSSDESQKELMPFLAEAKQPLLYTHTVLRKYHHAERGISNAQLEAVQATGGFIGLMPSKEMLEGTPSPDPKCMGSMKALAIQFKEAATIVGEKSISLGSDYNGAVSHLEPTCQTGTGIDKEGLWNIGQTSEVWTALEALGATKADKVHQKERLNRFLDAWSLLYH